MNARTRLFAAAFIVAVSACGLVAPAHAVAAAPAVEDSLLSHLSGVQNVCRPFPWLLTGGQPSAEALEAVAQAGFVDVFDLRGVDEPRGFDEPAVARSLKLNYNSIPVTPAAFPDSTITALRHHLAAHGADKPMFVHCASGNRVGAALLPWLVLDKGLSEDAALEVARSVGLHNAELTKRALDYIQTHEPPKE
jgi:protein tyrosine phosphatase (PTP) superfamily phosphohydrolase (DUF442 family)